MEFIEGILAGLQYAWGLAFTINWDWHGAGRTLGFFLAALPLCIPFWIPLFNGWLKDRKLPKCSICGKRTEMIKSESGHCYSCAYDLKYSDTNES